jgi:hypothetical protein
MNWHSVENEANFKSFGFLRQKRFKNGLISNLPQDTTLI